MKLSKRIPARTKTLTAKWCKKNFLVMSPKYREVRKKMRKPMDTCYWCNHGFEDGEMMALALFNELCGNKVLCQNCADDLMRRKGGA